jgi:adenosine kinase
MSRVLITGTIAYDVLLGFDGSFAETIRPDAIQQLSVSYFSPHYARNHGGTGANIAWNLRLLGGNPLLVGAVGHDGGAYLDLLHAKGIGTDAIEQLEAHVTATAVIGTDSGGRQIAFFHPGADVHATWPDLSGLANDVPLAIVSPRNVQAMQHCVQWCVSHGVPVLFDPGQQVHQFSGDDVRHLLRMSRGVIANAYEWSLLQEKLGCAEDGVLELCPLLIITKGEDGVRIVTREHAEVLQVCSTQSFVNPTGAGDGFRAGLLYGMQHDWSLLHAARLGAAVASFVVEIEGTLLPSLDIDLVRRRAEQTYGESLPEM